MDLHARKVLYLLDIFNTSSWWRYLSINFILQWLSYVQGIYESTPVFSKIDNFFLFLLTREWRFNAYYHHYYTLYSWNYLDRIGDYFVSMVKKTWTRFQSTNQRNLLWKVWTTFEKYETLRTFWLKKKTKKTLWVSMKVPGR